MVRPRLMFYCQHVLGIGHLIRSLSLVNALHEFDIYFLNGGKRISDIPFPANITVIDLPAIESDEEFEALHPDNAEHTLEQVQQARASHILEEWSRVQPEILLIELFPFGRKRFAPELVPLLARNRLAGSPSKVVCSLRDILVSKSDQARHEAWVCHLINRYFDMVLVHSDPTFQILDDTFGRVNDLQCDIHYTGFVAQQDDSFGIDSDSPMLLKQDKSPLIVVSIGGGRVGYELLECTIKAGIVLQQTLPHRMLVLGGPNIPDDQFLQLQELVEGQSDLTLQRYTAHFLHYLRNADLSISMAGYNTCMNIVTSGVTALMLPFTGHGNEEQTVRARKLEQREVLSVIEKDELEPETMRDKMAHILSGTREQALTRLDTDGAAKTARLMETLSIQSQGNKPKATKETWAEKLGEALQHLQDTQKEIKIFLRDDDSDEDIEPLRHLLDISLSRQIPLTLAVIPGTLQDSAIRLLKNHKRATSTLLEVHQHGWMHLNHEKEGRKCEFGPSRGYEEQREDIATGKALLEQTFHGRFFPAFTPPWNRCTTDTFKVLDDLGFRIFSKDQGKESVSGYRFREISTTIDLYRWKGGATMKAPDEIVNTLIDQIQDARTVGLLLHHKVMDAHAFRFLDHLLQELSRLPVVRFHTFQSLSTLIDGTT